MAKISASTINSMSKCELAHYISKTPEGRKFIQENGVSWVMPLGTITHRAIQKYDEDRFIKGIKVEKTKAELRQRWEDAHLFFFNEADSVKKEGISPEQQELANEIILPKLFEWYWEEDLRTQKELAGFLNSNQSKMKWKFPARTPLTEAYSKGFEWFKNYVFENPFDTFGTPVEFQTEVRYNFMYGDDEIIAFVDERYVFERNGERHVYLKEIKTSSTEYTPEDCGIDNQMTLYAFCEHVTNDTPYENIHLVMHQVSNGLVTITQRKEENIDFMLRMVDERADRLNKLASGEIMPLGKCGTNSYDHKQLMCDYKDICPIFQQAKNQPAPIVLGKKKGK